MCRSPTPAPCSHKRCRLDVRPARPAPPAPRLAAAVAARDLARAEHDLSRLVHDDCRVFVGVRHEGEAEHATCRLRNLSAKVVTPEQLARGARPVRATTSSPPHCARTSSRRPRLAVISERALLRAAPRERRFIAGTRLATFFDVRPGASGPRGPRHREASPASRRGTVAGITRDYLLLQFHGERHACSCHTTRSSKVSRCVGAGARTPGAGTSSAAPTGGRVKTSQQGRGWRWQASCCSCRLPRRPSRGSAFPRTAELHAAASRTAFPYEETEDHEESSTRSRTTWRHHQPMDRLVVGDVGYGKTEVALRAAFRAAARPQAGPGPGPHHHPRRSSTT